MSSPLWTALLPVWVSFDPGLNIPASPDSTSREFGDGFRKFGIGLGNLMDPLPGDPKHACSLGNAYQFLIHQLILDHSLDDH